MVWRSASNEWKNLNVFSTNDWIFPKSAMQQILMNHGLPFVGTKPELIIRMHEYKQANPHLRYWQIASKPRPASKPQPATAVEILDAVETVYAPQPVAVVQVDAAVQVDVEDTMPDKWFLDDDDSDMLPEGFYWPCPVPRLTQSQIDEADLLFA